MENDNRIIRINPTSKLIERTSVIIKDVNICMKKDSTICEISEVDLKLYFMIKQGINRYRNCRFILSLAITYQQHY